MTTKYIVSVKTRLKKNGKWVCKGFVYKDMGNKIVDKSLNEYDTEHDSKEAAERWGKLNTIQWLRRSGVAKDKIFYKK